MTPLLQFVDVSFFYEQRAVLENVSFCVEQGECSALIGPNGIGKTTLLRLAAGVLAKDLDGLGVPNTFKVFWRMSASCRLQSMAVYRRSDYIGFASS